MRAAAGLGSVANMNGDNSIRFSDRGCCEHSLLLIGDCEKWILTKFESIFFLVQGVEAVLT